jgi:transcriptional regulator with XRE-family HTH domain
VKSARITQAWTRQQVADRAGVSWSTEVRVEQGDPTLGLQTMCAVAEAVGLDVVVRVYPGRHPSLRDTGQLGHAEYLSGQAHPIWHPQLEILVGQHGESIDVGYFGPEEIIAVEIERMARISRPNTAGPMKNGSVSVHSIGARSGWFW